MPRNIRQRTKTTVPGIWQTHENTFVVFARWTCPVTGKRIKKETTASTLDEAIAVKQRLRPASTPTPKETTGSTPSTPTPQEPPTPTTASTTPTETTTLPLPPTSLTTPVATQAMTPAPPTTPVEERRPAQGTLRTTPRFGDFAVQWLALQVKRIEPSTRERYTAELAHWVARFGELRLDEVTPAHVRTVIAEMVDHAARATVNGRLRLLKQVLQQAVDDGLLDRNAATAVRSFPVGRTRGPRGTSLSPREFARYVDVTHAMIEDGTLKPDVGRMVLVLAWTGLRIGEIRALRFVDWDEDEQELHVDRAGWRNHVKGTKSGEPRRAAVVEPLRAVLLAQREWLQVTKHPGAVSGLMFPSDPDMRRRAHTAQSKRDPDRRARMSVDGSWLKASATLAMAVKKVVARAGTPELSPHGFRRTAENLARRAGVDELVRRAHAGWRSERVQALYATVDPDERRAAGAAVVALVAAVKQGTPPGQPAPSAPEAPPAPPQAPTSPATTAGTPGTPANAGGAVVPAASFVDEQGLPPRAAAPSPVAAGVAPAAPTAASEAARVVRPVRPEPVSGTPEGTPGVPDESMWN